MGLRGHRLAVVGMWGTWLIHLECLLLPDIMWRHESWVRHVVFFVYTIRKKFISVILLKGLDSLWISRINLTTNYLILLHFTTLEHQEFLLQPLLPHHDTLHHVIQFIVLLGLSQINSSVIWYGSWLYGIWVLVVFEWVLPVNCAFKVWYVCVELVEFLEIATVEYWIWAGEGCCGFVGIYWSVFRLVVAERVFLTELLRWLVFVLVLLSKVLTFWINKILYLLANNSFLRLVTDWVFLSWIRSNFISASLIQSCLKLIFWLYFIICYIKISVDLPTELAFLP